MKLYISDKCKKLSLIRSLYFGFKCKKQKADLETYISISNVKNRVKIRSICFGFKCRKTTRQVDNEKINFCIARFVPGNIFMRLITVHEIFGYKCRKTEFNKANLFDFFKLSRTA